MQLVIAAMATEPSVICVSTSPSWTDHIFEMSIMSTMSIPLRRVLGLHNRVGIGITTLTRPANRGILRRGNLRSRLEAIRICLAEDLPQILHQHTILRTTWASKAWLNRCKIELQQIVKLWLRLFIGAEQSLRLCVLLYQFYQFADRARSSAYSAASRHRRGRAWLWHQIPATC